MSAAMDACRVTTGEVASGLAVDRSYAGDGLLRPVPLVGIAMLLINDQFLKGAAPGVLTGKISDFAGMAYFPLFLVALVEVASAVVGFNLVGSRRVLAAAVVATGVVFTAIQLVPLAADAYRTGLGFAQWVISAPMRLVSGTGLGEPWRVRLASDLTDLIALLALPIAWLDGIRRCRTWTP